jgi:hypothetical protein
VRLLDHGNPFDEAPDEVIVLTLLPETVWTSVVSVAPRRVLDNNSTLTGEALARRKLDELTCLERWHYMTVPR